MDRRFVFVLVICLLCSLGESIEFFGGLTELMKYESTLPCEAGKNKSCFATNGLMGMTLDTASKAGLNISSVLIHDDNSVFVKTESNGTCLVNTKGNDTEQPVSFHCSKKGLAQNKLIKIDKSFSLKKKSKNQFALEEINLPVDETKRL